MTTWFSATAVIPQLRAEWSLDTMTASLLTIAVQVGFVFGALASSVGNLSDVFPSKYVIVLGAASAALVNAGLLQVDSVGAAIALRFLTGASLAAVYPPSLKLIATWFMHGRGIALGILVGALTLGTAGPHLVNALGGLRWQLVVAATSLLTIAGAALVVVAVKEGPYPFPRATFDPKQVRRILTNRRVRLASLGYFGHMWELYAMWGWFHIFYVDLISDRRAAAIAAFSVIGIGAVGCWFGGVLGERLGRARGNAMLLTASAACAVTIGWIPASAAWLVIGVGLVWGFTVVADSAQFSTLVTENADQAYVGTALTLQLALGFTLTIATIWLIPQVESTYGWGAAFSMLALGPLLGIVAMLRLVKEGEERAPALQPEALLQDVAQRGR